MQYRKVASSGDELSILGYGAMRFPQKNGRIDEVKATAQLRHAIDKGVNYVDTAYFYHGGQSEPFLGRALADGYREKVNLATKMPPWSVHKTTDFKIIFEDQCQKLKTDTIDYYLLHAVNRDSWNHFCKLDALSFLTEQKRLGKIRNVGFSFHGDRELFKMVIDAYPWDFCQIQYNFLDDFNQAGLEGLKYAASKDIAVFVMEPLRGGSLVHNIPTEVQGLYQDYPIAKTPVEWALGWIWNHPEVTMLLSGMTEDQHIEDNLLYADHSGVNSFDDDARELIAKVKAAYQSLLKIPCTGCQYCMPCPFGVDIPRCFDLYNSKYLLKQKNMTFFYWFQLGGTTGKPSNASLCTSCGKCVKHCPQSIQIPSELKGVTKDMESIFMKPAIKMLKWILKVQKTFAKTQRHKDHDDFDEIS